MRVSLVAWGPGARSRARGAKPPEARVSSNAGTAFSMANYIGLGLHKIVKFEPLVQMKIRKYINVGKNSIFAIFFFFNSLLIQFCLNVV